LCWLVTPDAEAWIKTLLEGEHPPAYGRLLLLPGAKAPMAVQARGKVVSCFNVADTTIDAHLAELVAGTGLGNGAGSSRSDEDRAARHALNAAPTAAPACRAQAPRAPGKPAGIAATATSGDPDSHVA
jgi:assimilatory nitrate reductase catalytic subunit